MPLGLTETTSAAVSGESKKQRSLHEDGLRYGGVIKQAYLVHVLPVSSTCLMARVESDLAILHPTAAGFHINDRGGSAESHPRLDVLVRVTQRQELLLRLGSPINAVHEAIFQHEADVRPRLRVPGMADQSPSPIPSG